MLTDRIKQITEQTRQVKQDTADAILAKAPPSKSRFFIIHFSEIGIANSSEYTHRG